MKRVVDLEAPLEPDHPCVLCLLPPRPPPAPPAPGEVPRPKFKLKAALSPRTIERLRAEYWEHVKQPVPLTFGAAELSPERITAVVPGKAWVVPSMLDATECAAHIRLGESAGLEPAIAASGAVGLRMLSNFVQGAVTTSPAPPLPRRAPGPTRYCKRVIACMDVRANDCGDLVVTKGDQYDVREQGDGGEVRNLGKPVDLCARYYDEGADEICVRGRAASF